MTNKKSLILLSFAILISTSTWAGNALTYSFVPKQGKTTFLAVGHPSALKVRGEGGGPNGELTMGTDNSLSGVLSFDLSTLKTGIDMRDEHMKKRYLKTESFPNATLKISNLKMPLVEQKVSNGTDVPFNGLLTLKGEERPVVGKLTTTGAAPSSNSVKVVATFPIKLTDFKIDLPSYAGITIAEDVNVTVESNVEIRAATK